MLWINKTWTLVELHQRIFHHFRHLLLKWYRACSAGEGNKMSYSAPEHEWKGEKLTEESLEQLYEANDIKEQFGVFFPNLTEENWAESLNARSFDQNDLPYQLKLVNMSGYR